MRSHHMTRGQPYSLRVEHHGQQSLPVPNPRQLNRESVTDAKEPRVVSLHNRVRVDYRGLPCRRLDELFFSRVIRLSIWSGARSEGGGRRCRRTYGV